MESNDHTASPSSSRNDMPTVGVARRWYFTASCVTSRSVAQHSSA